MGSERKEFRSRSQGTLSSPCWWRWFGVVVGLGALLGAATITDRPPLFPLACLLAFCVTCLLGLLLATLKDEVEQQLAQDQNTSRRRDGHGSHSS
jgi:hypothetical protein